MDVFDFKFRILKWKIEFWLDYVLRMNMSVVYVEFEFKLILYLRIIDKLYEIY